MGKVVINSYEDFEKLVGQQIGISDYVELTQERINLFADATLDHQWIHVDPERAKVESPFHSTIAHGYLTPESFSRIRLVLGVSHSFLTSGTRSSR